MEEPRRMLDTYEPGEFVIPEYRLIQSVGGGYAKEIGGKPGQLFCALDDSIVDQLEIVIVDVIAGRVYWGRTEIEEAPPECYSLDAKSMVSVDGKDCSKCEHRLDNPWSVPATERREMCTVRHNILAINLNDSMPILIRAGGISSLPVRQLITQLRLSKQLKGEYHRAVIQVGTQKKKTSAGEAYALRFKLKSLITDEIEAGRLKNESIQLLGTPLPLPLLEGGGEEPLAFTPEGRPIYSQEEVNKIKGELETEPKVEGKKEPVLGEIDLDF